MKIDESYSVIIKAGQPCQVFCGVNTNRSVELTDVTVRKLWPTGKSKEQAESDAERRERKDYDRFIGVFDFSRDIPITYTEYEAECIAGHQAYRLAHQPAEPVLQPYRPVLRVDGVSHTERPVDPLELRQTRPQGTDSRYARTGQANGSGHTPADAYAPADYRGTVRAIQGSKRRPADKPAKSRPDGDAGRDIPNETESREESFAERFRAVMGRFPKRWP